MNPELFPEAAAKLDCDFVSADFKVFAPKENDGLDTEAVESEVDESLVVPNENFGAFDSGFFASDPTGALISVLLPASTPFEVLVALNVFESVLLLAEFLFPNGNLG